jgi:hypothetical protein
MSVFSTINKNTNQDAIMENELKNPQELEEQFLIEECSHFNEAQIKMFLESDLCTALLEAGKFRKKTLVRLSGQADLDRRNKLAAMQLAKENNDPLFEKLALNRVKERELLGKIVQKYGNKGARIAKASQRDYIKNRMPQSFMQSGGNLR